MPAVSDKELGPELALKIAYLIGERRSGNVESLSCSTEMQLLGDGYEVRELSELHEIDVNAAVSTAVLAICNSQELPQLGDKSWTCDDERVLLQRVIFVRAERRVKVAVSTQQQPVSLQYPESTRI